MPYMVIALQILGLAGCEAGTGTGALDVSISVNGDYGRPLPTDSAFAVQLIGSGGPESADVPLGDVVRVGVPEGEWLLRATLEWVDPSSSEPDTAGGYVYSFCEGEEREDVATGEAERVEIPVECRSVFGS